MFKSNFFGNQAYKAGFRYNSHGTEDSIIHLDIMCDSLDFLSNTCHRSQLNAMVTYGHLDYITFEYDDKTYIHEYIHLHFSNPTDSGDKLSVANSFNNTTRTFTLLGDFKDSIKLLLDCVNKFNFNLHKIQKFYEDKGGKITDDVDFIVARSKQFLDPILKIAKAFSVCIDDNIFYFNVIEEIAKVIAIENAALENKLEVLKQTYPEIEFGVVCF